MTTEQDAAAVEATVAQQEWRDSSGEMAGLVTGCFPRRETRQTFREMIEAMLMGVAQAKCWTLAEALGHGGPHRLQHFLARAVRDHDAVRGRAACWVAHQLADDQAVLVVDETGDEKSSADAVFQLPPLCPSSSTRSRRSGRCSSNPWPTWPGTTSPNSPR